MGSRLKEDEKNEKIVRGLLKQSANRKCINCNMLGPQYACTTFSTFICTTCSGIHREFTHRVKSVSMAKFTPQEIASLQAGGNECAREIYFKEWDPQRNFPDSNNVDRLRDFIKQVYVHRRYTGERSSDRAPQADKEEANGNRRSDAYHSGSQSLAYDDTYQRRYNDRASPGYDVRRSPGYEQDNKRHSDLRKSPVPSPVLNDWRREDRFSNGRKSEDRRSSDGESKSGIRSPDSQKVSDISSPSTVRPIGDILGDNVVPLRISEPPKKNNSSTITDGPTFTQGTASSSSLASSNGTAVEVKKEISLIDFDAEPEPPFMAGEPQVQQSTASLSAGQSTSTQGDGNWAFSDNILENKVSQTPPSSESLESVLPQLSFPAAPTSGSASNGAFPTPLNGLFPSSNGGNLQFASVGNVSTVGFNGVPSFPTGSSNQGLADSSVAHASQAVAPLAAQTREDKSSGMKELPVDLFASTYFAGPYQAPGWQAGPVPGMGYPIQYNPAMSMGTFPQPSKPSNPFDATAQASPTSATMFPSMSSLHAALPNMEPPRGLAQAATASWISPQSSSYPSTVPPLAQSFGLPMPGTYMGQQLPSTVAPSGPQGFGAFGSEAIASFASLNTAAASTPNPLVGGNPFN